MRIRSIAAAVGLTLSMAAVPAVSSAAPQDAAYAAALSGTAEVPAVTTTASGAATAGYDAEAGELDIAVTAYGLEDVTMAHLHNAAAGENGPVVVQLLELAADGLALDVDGGIARMTIDDDDVIADGDVDGTLADLVAEIDAGNIYVNIHTTANPAGELRGQLAALTIDDAFGDDEGSVLEDEINAMAAAGAILGDGEGNVDHTADVTRAQLTAILARSLNLPDGGDVPFGDVVDSPFQAEIAAAAAAGLVLGDADGNFNGSDTVTRGQLAAIVSRAFSIHDIPVAQPFGDISLVAGVFSRDIAALWHAGVVNGFSETEFRPVGTVTRAQAAAFAARAHTIVDVDTNDLDDLFDLTVLHNNDGESAVVRTFEDDGTTIDQPGVASFKTLVDQAKATAAVRTNGEVLVSSGDNFLAGTAIEASVQSGTFYDAIALEALGYDALQLGNHDFDFGPQFLSDFLDEYTTTPQYLAANIDAAGTPLADEQAAGDIAPSTTITVDGREVGIVGAITEELASISSPGDVVVSAVQPAVQTEIDTLTAAGVDIIVLISHLQGVDTDLALLTALDGVDIAIAGGGDEDLANPGESLVGAYGPYPIMTPRMDGTLVPVVTTAGSYSELGRLIGGFDDDGELVVVRGESQLIANGADFAQDADLVDQVETPVAEFQANLAADVIGTTEVELDGTRELVRTQETNMGNLLADALLDAATTFAAADADVPTPVVAFQNGGGIRNSVVKSAGADITRLDTFNVAPFGNFVSIDTITHGLLLDVLENAVSEVENVDGRFLQVSDGFAFTYDGFAAAGSRIVDVTVGGTLVIDDGTVLAPSDTIVIATNDFTLNGGDSFPFDGEFIRTTSTYQGALANYIETTLGGTVTAADYPAGGEGRITPVPIAVP